MENISQEDMERAQAAMRSMAAQFQAGGHGHGHSHGGDGHGHSHGGGGGHEHMEGPAPADLEKIMAMQKAMFAGYQDTTSEVLNIFDVT